MLLFALALLIMGYTFAYAAIRGDNASINGTPLWKAPWLPFVAAFSGIGSSSSSSSSSSSDSAGTGSYGSTSTGVNQAEASTTALLNELRQASTNLRSEILRRVRAGV